MIRAALLGKILAIPGLFGLAFLLVGCGGAPPLASLPPPTPSSTFALLPIPTRQATPMPCLLVHAAATSEAFSADFTGRGHMIGPADAPVTIIEFAGYQCPMCAFLESSLRQVRAAHPKDVRMIFIPYYQTALDKDALALQTAEAADLQGRFWEMNDLLYEKMDEWYSMPVAEFKPWLFEQAASLGLDIERLGKDTEGPVVAERLQKAAPPKGSGGVTSPVGPSLFVNSSSPYTGLVDFPSLDTVIRMEALEARQFNACPDWVIDPARQYLANLQTAKGEVVIELYADKAPLAVNNFIFLARSGWYDGSTFYRLLPGSIAMTGDPSGTGMGSPGYFFQTENTTGLSFSQAGMVAMDNSGIDTNGSRFFITMAPSPQMDGQYTLIGRVISGLDVLNKLTPRDPGPAVTLPAGDELIRLTISEK